MSGASTSSSMSANGSSNTGSGGGGGGRRPGRLSGGGGAGGVSRVTAKITAALERGDFYEAHQMYRTLFHRLRGQKKYAELESLLYKGALLLFDHGEVGSGVDLTRLYVEVLEEGDCKRQEDYFQKVARLYSLIPVGSPEKDAIMTNAIRWSTQGDNIYGDPRLHQIFAYNLWSSKRYPESRNHFLHSRDGVGCGTMLVEFHQIKGYAREMDIFIVGTVLQLICLKKHIVAAIALKSYTEGHPSIKRGPPYKLPLLNFVWLLLLAIEHKKSFAAFSIIIEKYKASLGRDPLFLDYLDRIGQSFFGVPPPQRQRPGGMFSGLFDSFFNVLNTDDDQEQQPSQSQSLWRMETEELD